MIFFSVYSSLVVGSTPPLGRHWHSLILLQLQKKIHRVNTTKLVRMSGMLMCLNFFKKNGLTVFSLSLVLLYLNAEQLELGSPKSPVTLTLQLSCSSDVEKKHRRHHPSSPIDWAKKCLHNKFLNPSLGSYLVALTSRFPGRN